MISKTYPTSLTNKSWQKAKGILAKAAGESGVGAALDKCEKSFPDDFHETLADLLEIEGKYRAANGVIAKRAIDTDNIIGKREIDADRKRVMKDGTRLAASLKEYKSNILAARKTTSLTEKIYKASNTIPKSATKAAAEIVKELDAELGRLEKTPNPENIAAGELDKYAKCIPEMPDYPDTPKKLKRFLNDAFWSPVFERRARKMALIDTWDFFNDIAEGKLSKETYEKYVVDDNINVSGKLKAAFATFVSDTSKDWSAAPWAQLVDSQLLTFHSDVYAPILNKTK